MKLRLFGCRKFRFLQNEALDRALAQHESKFMERHRKACSGCCWEELQGNFALNMLRQAAIEPETEPNFEERVLRLLKVRTVRSSLGYWTPAVAGFAVAGFALVAALQMISQPNKLPNVVPSVEVRRELSGPFFPELEEKAEVQEQR